MKFSHAFTFFLLCLPLFAQADGLELTLGESVEAHVERGEDNHYKISGLAGQTITGVLDQLSADADLRLHIGSQAGADGFDCKSISGGTQTDSCSVTLTHDADVYIAVVGYREADYQLVVNAYYKSHVERGEYKHYKVSALAGQTVTGVLDQLSGDADLRLHIGSQGGKDDFDCKSLNGETKTDTCSVTLAHDADVYIAVNGYHEADYRLAINITELFYCGYETHITGDGCWDEVNESEDYSVQQVGTITLANGTSRDIREGQKAARFEVRMGDNPLFPGCGRDCGERAEVAEMKTQSGQIIDENAQSGTQFYAFSVMFDTDWKNPAADPVDGLWAHFFQLHGPDDFNGSAAISLNTVLSNDEDEGISLILHTGDLDDYESVGIDLKHNNSLNKGNWIDFIIKIKFATDNSGSIDIWRRDSVLGETTEFINVLNESGLATLQYRSSKVSDGNHYWKHGFYRPTQEDELVNILWVDGISRGTSFNKVKEASFPRN